MQLDLNLQGEESPAQKLEEPRYHIGSLQKMRRELQFWN